MIERVAAVTEGLPAIEAEMIKATTAVAGFIARASGVYANLHLQPGIPVGDGLRIEAVSRVIPANLLGLRRGCV